MDIKKHISALPDFGKIPPQACDMEEAVLGAMMLEKQASVMILDILKPENFYKESHQKIFKVMFDLNLRESPIDMFTISEELRASNELDSIGGPVYLAQLTGKITSAANVEYYAKIVAQKYMQREIIRISTELQNRAFDDTYDITELIEFAENSLFSISHGTIQKDPVHVGKITDNVLAGIVKIINHEIKLIGVPSGFTILDRATGGFKSKEFTIIAGRPSMGKTALVLQICKNAASLNSPVCLFSCEMGEDDLGRRLISSYSNKSNIALINGYCDPIELAGQSEPLYSMPFYIDETSNISLAELRAKTRKLILKHGIKMIVVDYLGLMKCEGFNRENEVSNISRGLKSIAKDLNIAVIGVSQLNRSLEKTASKKPMLSDLRDSGSLEQDADIVLFVHRPAKYEQTTYDIDHETISTKDLMILILAKNRNGITCEIPVQHNEFMTSIYDFETTENDFWNEKH